MLTPKKLEINDEYPGQEGEADPQNLVCRHRHLSCVYNSNPPPLLKENCLLLYHYNLLIKNKIDPWLRSEGTDLSILIGEFISHPPHSVMCLGPNAVTGAVSSC